ncbi:MAG: hypothetical protein KF819_21970 [Labilithrix sp.]|nr:hypothetical protein [Labilithrix sp.]
MRLLPVSFLVVAAIPSCKPDFGERESFVDRPVVLAVRMDPPEVTPGAPVTTSILVASPDGPIAFPPTSWAFCASPKLLSENGAVSVRCTRGGVAPIGDARGGLTAPVPADACFLFGPEIQSTELRPRDPDVTGGFYQPIRATVAAGGDTLMAFGFARITCKLASIPADAATIMGRDYAPNRNPSLLPIEVIADGVPREKRVPRGARVVLRASWSEGDAESYLMFDVRAQAVVTRRESLRASWFTTAGSFESDRTGRDEMEPESFTENVWTAPTEARDVYLWVVLRDSRGGTAFASTELTTE